MEKQVLTLRQWRASKWMGQAEFAAFLGVNARTYIGWEQGKSVPRLRFQRQIAERLRVAPEQILYPAAKHIAAVA